MKRAFLAATLLLLAAAAIFFAERASAIFTDVFTNSNNVFSTDTLNPPTGLAASVVGSSIRLDWTPTVDTYATGYKVMRGTTTGGPYGEINSVTPRTATTYTDNTVAAGIRYYYVLQTYFQNWLSVYSNEANAALPTNTGWRSPTAQAAVTSGSGDNDGFEISPTNAFADGGAYAEDDDSGTFDSQDCASVFRDRHRFYDYGFTIPSGATISGIEVRLDAWVYFWTVGDPKMCVVLSWDGGTTWTSAKITANLTDSQATYILGSTSDTWGRTWSSGDFSNANFRVRITNVADSTLRNFRLDWVPVRVTYTPP